MYPPNLALIMCNSACTSDFAGTGTHMQLTNKAIQSLKPTDKIYTIADSHGLSLRIMPNGQKYWRYRYRHLGKEKMLALGVYPIVSLLEARSKRDEARKLRSTGVDPSAHKKARKQSQINQQENSFEIIAREWFNQQKNTWVESHATKIIKRFERDLFPYLGKIPLAKISPPQLLEALRKIEKREAVETAHRALSDCGRVFRYAIATGRAERDISQDLKGALSAAKGSHFSAIIEPTKLGTLLRMIDDYDGTPIVQCALQFLPLVFVRPYELRHAKWTDIDFDKSQWSYIVSKTKTPHIVPLSTQAIAILQRLQPLTGHSEFIFPSARSSRRAMSDNAVLAALRRMGISKEEMSGHGFRATARTLLDEVLKVRPDYIEHQLAHSVRDPLGRAYNRTSHIIERAKMMQQWADYLDNLKGQPDGSK